MFFIGKQKYLEIIKDYIPKNVFLFTQRVVWQKVIICFFKDFFPPKYYLTWSHSKTVLLNPPPLHLRWLTELGIVGNNKSAVNFSMSSEVGGSHGGLLELNSDTQAAALNDTVPFLPGMGADSSELQKSFSNN